MGRRLAGGEPLESSRVSAKWGRAGYGGKGRSYAQQLGSAALVQVMKTWEDLSDEERLAWQMHPWAQRRYAIDVFKQVNLRRVRRGAELARVPPEPALYDARAILKGLEIENRAGRITLKLKFLRAPGTPRTVWGSLPCNRGAARAHKCPRLGWLPTLENGECDITSLYFGKHGDRIERQRLPLVGKRIFIRLRQEMDEGASLFEEVKAVVPAPRGRPKR